MFGLINKRDKIFKKNAKTTSISTKIEVVRCKNNIGYAKVVVYLITSVLSKSMLLCTTLVLVKIDFFFIFLTIKNRCYIMYFNIGFFITDINADIFNISSFNISSKPMLNVQNNRY